MATSPLTHELSSSLLLRRRKAVAEINCNVPSQCLFESEAFFSPEKLLQTASKAAQVLADQSPLAGPVSKALLRKRKQMRSSAPATLLSQTSQDADLPIAEVGFHRVVYHKVRRMRDERFDSSYGSLKDVVLDIMHAVRVCLQATRFIAHAKTSCLATKANENCAAQHSAGVKLAQLVPSRCYAAPKPYQKVAASLKCLEETYTKCRGFGDHPAFGLHSDILLDRKWQSLLEGLSPMTPQVESWMISSPNRFKPLCA